MPNRPSRKKIKDVGETNAFGFKAMQRVITPTERPQPKLHVMGQKMANKGQRGR
jgi:hypothetical protein